MERKIDVEIMGQIYRLKTDRSHEEIEEITSMVKGSLRKIKEDAPYISDTKASVLLSLNLAEEIIRLKKKIEELKKYLP